MQKTPTKSLSKIYESEVVHRESAAASYEERALKIQSQINKIQMLLQGHSKKQEESPTDWGWAGDLGYVSSELEQIIIFLGEGLH